MYAATAMAAASGRRLAQPQITDSRPKVATASLKTCAPPDRVRAESASSGSPNITCAVTTPANAPASCAARYPGTRTHESPPCDAAASVTTGFICAPEIGPKARIRHSRAAPVARLFASSAMATFPPDSRSPMMPEPTTAQTSSAVATNSAAAARPLVTTGCGATTSRAASLVNDKAEDLPLAVLLDHRAADTHRLRLAGRQTHDKRRLAMDRI